MMGYHERHELGGKAFVEDCDLCQEERQRSAGEVEMLRYDPRVDDWFDEDGEERGEEP
jgi:hypothetical protein